jgi:hypothetical protein
MPPKIKKSPGPPGLRKDFYELSDGLQGMRGACRRDPVIKDCIEEMERAFEKLRMHLNANYDWD